MKNKRVLIVDDHPIIRAAVGDLLKEHGYEPVGDASDGFEALEKIHKLRPDYMLLDITLDNLDGLSVLQRIATDLLEVKTLVFTANRASTYGVRCMQAGAMGFINKSAGLPELVKGLNALADGYLYFPKEVLEMYRGTSNTPNELLSNLTNKELVILQLLANGYSNLEIASKLNLSNKTISGHKINVLKKLGVRTTIELATIARELDLL
ncbi:response regulator transcription factor [Pseudomonas sp. LD120]|uniref:response regulator transcription factor n=1 Tax=Pseudomonas sp. LD120 TaxID=485751 RepID=UPI00135A89AD|nr:response regulator transcription factor [Pseudomonas sp. LD120]KAF0865985.1 response regulator [Pseudomonas sp. LD120]